MGLPPQPAPLGQKLGSRSREVTAGQGGRGGALRWRRERVTSARAESRLLGMSSGSAPRLRALQRHLGSREGRGMEPVSSPLTTHVLDTASGLPAQGLCLCLSRLENHGQQWTELRRSYTNPDGRCPGLLLPGQMKAGTYKLTFDTEGYWKKRGQDSFYPYVEVRATGWHGGGVL
uniref:Transthyretin n=2 Tax=Myotis myotis TaxID=51298 RepID=A0A7J7R4S0_MYOMY|nr:hypothetical protein mMyoMyo1_020226 [Myotis myotis]